MMKIIILTLLYVSTLGILTCKSQPFVTCIPEYIDEDYTNCMIDSLQKKGINDFFIYLTNVDRGIVSEKKSVNKIITVSFLIWEENGKTNIILLTDSCIYKNIIALDDVSIFLYSHLNHLWLRKDENIYKVVMPFAIPYQREIVIYVRNKNDKTFFEIGENVSYKLNSQRNKYRNEFISLLKSLCLSSFNKWAKVSDYHREWW